MNRIKCITLHFHPFYIIIIYRQLSRLLMNNYNNNIAVDVWHVHCGQIRFVHVGWMSRRVHVHQRISIARHRRSVVRQCVGLYRLLQRNSVNKLDSHTIQTLRTGKIPYKPFTINTKVVWNQIKTFFYEKQKHDFV